MARHMVCLTALAAFGAAAAQAQAPAAVTGTTRYAPADFARFAPQTARDLVRAIPGFQIEEADSGRGFGQASGNVLLNGQRISGKSTDTLSVLGRIPASRVDYIELVDAATLGIPGVSGLVANVVTSGTGLSGVWDYEIRLRERLEPKLNEGTASLTGKTAGLAWTAGLEAEGNRFGNRGPEFVFDGDGALVERRDEEGQGAFERVRGSLTLGWSGTTGAEANLNAALETFNFNERLQGVRTPVSGDPALRGFEDGEDEWSSELGGDYAVTLVGGRLKLIGLHRHEDSRFRGRVREQDPASGLNLSGERLDADFIENEAILRAEYDWSRAEGRDWQVALETAYNRLDAGASYFILAADGSERLESRDLPTLVEERRYDASLTHTRRITPRLSLQASLAGEISELSSQVGADTRAQDFLRPKGFVALTFEPDPANDNTLRFEREVGQLSFSDFVANQDLNNGNDDAGNRDVVPDQAWRIELAIDRGLGPFGAAQVTAFHEAIEDLVGRVPLPDGGEGPGNIDAASLSGLLASTTLRFDPLGLAGVQLGLEVETYVSSVEDPLTGETRRISGDSVSYVLGELRWDIPGSDIAVLLGWERERSGQNFRLSQISKFDQSEPFVWAALEHKDLFGLNAFVRAGNLLDSRDTGERIFFTPDRTGEVSGRQRFDRDYGYNLVFGVAGKF